MNKTFKPGDRVYHPLSGAGTVLATGEGGTGNATISFFNWARMWWDYVIAGVTFGPWLSKKKMGIIT